MGEFISNLVIVACAQAIYKVAHDLEWSSCGDECCKPQERHAERLAAQADAMMASVGAGEDL